MLGGPQDLKKHTIAATDGDMIEGLNAEAA